MKKKKRKKTNNEPKIIIPNESIRWIYSNKAATMATPAKDPATATLLTEAAFGEPVGGERDWAGPASPDGTVVGGAPTGVEAVGGAGGEAVEVGESVGGWLTGAVVGAGEGGLVTPEGAGAGAAARGDWAGVGVGGRGDLVGAGPGAWATAEDATRARKRKTTTDFEAIVFS